MSCTVRAQGGGNESGPYLRTEIGPTIFEGGRLNNFGGATSGDVDFSIGGSLDAAVGYAFNRYFSTDFEFGFVGADIDSGPAGFFSDNSVLYQAPFLANITLALPTPDKRIVPYIGAGAGGSVVGFNTDGFGNGTDAVFGEKEDVVFAWQAFAGVRFALNDHMSLGVRYRYLATEDATFSYRTFPPGPDFHVGFDGLKTHSIQFVFQITF